MWAVSVSRGTEIHRGKGPVRPANSLVRSCVGPKVQSLENPFGPSVTWTQRVVVMNYDPYTLFTVLVGP